MSQAFTCPNCQASLEYHGGISPTIRCQYCNTTVIVPEELRSTSNRESAAGGDQLPFELTKLTEIAQLIQGGRKIEAIKLLRQISNMDLKAAKEAVERMERGESVQFTSMSSSSRPAFDVTPHPLQQTPAAVTVSTNTGGRVGCVLLSALLILGVAIAGSILFLTTSSGSTSEVIAPVVKAVESNIESGFSGAATMVATAVPLPTATPGFAEEVFSFGGQEGVGPGYFNDTRNIGIDAQGNIYTGDYSDGRIQVFDSQGNFIKQWFIADPDAPMISMTADQQGHVYVIERGDINQYDGMSGELQRTLPSPGGAGYRDMTVAPDGTLVAFSFSPPDALTWFDDQGQVVQTVAEILSSQTGDPEADARIAVDGLGNIYLLGGTFTQVVFKYDADGKFVTRIGSEGRDDGQLNSPDAIAVDNQGRVYVEDFDGIDVFATDGRFLDTISFRGVAFDMVFDNQNNLFLMERNGNRVVQLALSARVNQK